MSTYRPLRVVVAVPPGWKKTPALLAKLLGEARPVSANGIGQSLRMSPQVPGVGQISVEVTG